MEKLARCHPLFKNKDTKHARWNEYPIYLWEKYKKLIPGPWPNGPALLHRITFFLKIELLNNFHFGSGRKVENKTFSGYPKKQKNLARCLPLFIKKDTKHVRWRNILYIFEKSIINLFQAMTIKGAYPSTKNHMLLENWIIEQFSLWIRKVENKTLSGYPKKKKTEKLARCLPLFIKRDTKHIRWRNILYILEKILLTYPGQWSSKGHALLQRTTCLLKIELLNNFHFGSGRKVEYQI